jgi:hypothetical protein
MNIVAECFAAAVVITNTSGPPPWGELDREKGAGMESHGQALPLREIQSAFLVLAQKMQLGGKGKNTAHHGGRPDGMNCRH